MKGDSDFLLWLVWFDLEPEMGLFEAYLDTMEDFLESEIQEHSKQVQDLRRKRLQLLQEEMEVTSGTGRRIDPLGFDSYFPTSEEEGVYFAQEMLDRFSTILRRSFFVAVFSSVEAQLNRLSHFLEKRLNLPTSLEEVKPSPDRSIERAREYLVTKAKIAFPDSEEWNKLVIYKGIRNHVVHNEGQLPSDKEFQGLKKKRRKEIEALKEYILEHPYLNLSTPAPGPNTKDYRPEIIFRRGFCAEVVKVSRDFFQELNETVYTQIMS